LVNDNEVISGALHFCKFHNYLFVLFFDILALFKEL